MDTQAYRLPNDTVTVDHQVLLTVIRAAALNIEGVVRIGYGSGTIERMLGRGGFSESGIYAVLEDDTLTVDIFVVLVAHAQLREVSSQIQEAIRRTMQQYVGMTVKKVNVYVEDVVFEKT